MKLSSPQRRLFSEADIGLRELERRAAIGGLEEKTRYYRALLRSGKISHQDLYIAALLDNEAARQIVDAPEIRIVNDLVDFICVDSPSTVKLFRILFNGLPIIEPHWSTMTPREEAAWALGQFSRSHDYDYNHRMLRVAISALEGIVAVIGLQRVIDLIRPHYVHPLLRDSQ